MCHYCSPRNSIKPYKRVTLIFNCFRCTMEGNIMVDGVLASCHSSVDHDVAHIATIPMQWFPEAIEWILGMEEGFSVYIDMAVNLGDWVLPFGQM